MSFKYRKGEAPGSGLLSLMSILMIVFIVAGILGSITIFFGKGYDYRETESRTLLNRVKECVEREKFDLSSLNRETFLEKCTVSSKIVEDGEHMIYIKDKKNVEFLVGVADFKVRCGLVSRFENKDLPLCSDYKNEDYEILVGSSQNSRRVAA